MIAFVGQTRAPRVVAKLARLGVGECTQRGELGALERHRAAHPARPWFHDNRAFGDWQAGRSFECVRWIRDQWRIRQRRLAPAFVVVPDLVGAGAASLAFSSQWRDEVAPGVPAYLVVQEGMTPATVGAALDESADRGLPYAGLFVGGAAIEWKIGTAPTWLELARARDMRLHVGRVGVPERVAWARELGVDSIDSSLPLFTAARLDRFLVACGIDPTA